MTILAHPEWPQIRQHLRVEAYDRDTNADGDVRHRLEVTEPDTAALRSWLLSVVTTCAKCGATMHPVRTRSTWNTWYYAAACPLEVTTACARSREAAQEYRDIVADLTGNPPVTPQLSLFP